MRTRTIAVVKLLKAFFADRTDPALGNCVGIRCAHRCFGDIDPFGLKDEMYTVCTRSASTVKKAYAKQEECCAAAGYRGGMFRRFSRPIFSTLHAVCRRPTRSRVRVASSTIPPRHRFLGEEYVHFLRTKSRCQRNAAAERGGILDTLQQEADHKGEVEWEIDFISMMPRLKHFRAVATRYDHLSGNGLSRLYRPLFVVCGQSLSLYKVWRKQVVLTMGFIDSRK